MGFLDGMKDAATQNPDGSDTASPALNAVPEHTGRHHLIVLVAVVTFCVCLFIAQLALFWFGTPHAFQRMTWTDPLVVLQLTVGIATVVYFALRKDEGDFRALLCVAIALFLGEEVQSFLARNFGSLPFRAPAMMTAFASAFFGAVAVAAASFDHDEHSRETCHSLATAGAFALLVVSSLRFVGGIFRTTDALDTCSTIVLGLAIFGLGSGLAYTYIRERYPKSRPDSAEHWVK